MRRKSPTTVEELADRLDLGPEHVPLLRLALVHRSQGDVAATNNERLEFLGDSILGMLTNEYLYAKYPTASEGELTRMKANVVNKTSLARAARPLGLGQLLDMARSEEALGGRDRSSTLADAFEAVLGAIYLNAGLAAARRFVHEYLFPEVDLTRSWDYKSTLQEQLQERFRSAPEYRIISEAGPAHAKEFIAEVYLEKELLGTGRGGSKKQAEQVAAAEGLMYLATRVKKTRRTRKSTAAAVAEAGVDTVAVRPGDSPMEATDGTPSPVAGSALDTPAAPARAVRRTRKKATPYAVDGQDGVGPALPEGELSTEMSRAAPDAPATAPVAPARRTRRTRKAAEGEEDAPLVAVAQVVEPSAGDGARNRGGRKTRAARPVGEAAGARGQPVATEPASTVSATPEAVSPPRPRARRRKPDAAVLDIEPASGN